MQLGWHPMAAVQYTFTHKQYTEQHNKTANDDTHKIPSLASTLTSLTPLYKPHVLFDYLPLFNHTNNHPSHKTIKQNFDNIINIVIRVAQDYAQYQASAAR